jgi:hypothetical protein
LNTVKLHTRIRVRGELWLEARCVCGCVTQPEILVWNGGGGSRF